MSSIVRKVNIGLAAVAVLLLATIAWPTDTADVDRSDAGPADPSSTTTSPPASAGSSSTTTSTTTSTTAAPYDGWVDPASSGQPWGTTVEGLLTFRGNPTRSYYGEGPVPEDPQIVWRFPDEPMCSRSAGGTVDVWCGSGWTGQPSVFEYDGATWATLGSYSRNVHFLDAADGTRILPDFPTGDIIKGSVTVDPDGYPLLYTGSRDNYYRVIAFDREEPTELWRLSADAVSPTKWNDDWDGAGLVIDDYLFEGGENSQIHVVKLNRGYDADGLVTVDPELVWHAPGWDDDLLAAVGDNVSIENSVAISGDTLYFANSGGLIQGWDISGLKDGVEPTRVFRYWAGDDIDASLVIDDEGMIYAGVEYERGTGRSQEIGQVIKLDPTRPDDPLVWGVPANTGLDTGVWATPAIHRDLLIVPTHSGFVLGLDRATGEERWRMELGSKLWQSPVVVDDVWIQGDCLGMLRGYDVSDTTVEPPLLWEVELTGCIESTPAVWRGRIIVGTWSGYIYGLG